MQDKQVEDTTVLVKALRNGLGNIIIFISWLTRPAKIKRTPEAQQQADREAQELALYQFRACPFCVKVRRQIHRLNVPIAVVEAASGPAREELEQGGGRVKVPCLKIGQGTDAQWMYESSDIIAYLEQRFEPQTA